MSDKSIERLCYLLVKRNALNKTRRYWDDQTRKWRRVYKILHEYYRGSPMWEKLSEPQRNMPKKEAYLKWQEAKTMYEVYKLKILRYTAKHSKEIMALGHGLKRSQCTTANGKVSGLRPRGDYSCKDVINEEAMKRLHDDYVFEHLFLREDEVDHT